MKAERRNDVLIPFLIVTMDFCAVVGAFVASYYLRFLGPISDLIPVTKGYPPLEGYVLGGLIVAPVWILLFNAKRVYRARRSYDLTSEFFLIVRTAGFGMLVVMSLAFFYRDFSYSLLVLAAI